MWFFGGIPIIVLFFLNCLHVSCTYKTLTKSFWCSKFVILLDSSDKNISLAFLFSSSSSFSCYLDDIFSAHTLYILPYSIHYIYVRLCHFRSTAFYLCSTLMGCYSILLRLLICIVCCWLPLSHQRVFRPKSQSSSDEAISRVSRLIHLYTTGTHTHTVAESKPSQATSFTLTAAKERFFFFPCAQYINYGTLYTVCLLIVWCVSLCSIISSKLPLFFWCVYY